MLVVHTQGLQAENPHRYPTLNLAQEASIANSPAPQGLQGQTPQICLQPPLPSQARSAQNEIHSSNLFFFHRVKDIKLEINTPARE